MANLTIPPSLDDIWGAASCGGEYGADSLVRLSNGIGHPIFIIHWGSGNTRFLRPLIDRMRGVNPVYALEAVGIRSRQRPLLSVDEMAQYYLSRISSVQPGGPYFLVGLCSGGQIAYELGRRLAAAGERIGLLAIVNGVSPGTRMLDPSDDPADIYRFRLSALEREFGNSCLGDNLPDLILEMKKRYWLDEEADPDNFYWHQSIWAACCYAQENYAARPYDGPVQVFTSADVEELSFFSWEGCASRSTAHILKPDTSDGILQDPVFCEVLQRSIQAVT